MEPAILWETKKLKMIDEGNCEHPAPSHLRERVAHAVGGVGVPPPQHAQQLQDLDLGRVMTLDEIDKHISWEERTVCVWAL
jgi:hypothetical protein